MATSLDTNLITRVLNYHGQPLRKIWEDEREDDVKNVSQTLDYHIYQQRTKELCFEDRSKRLKVHAFIVKHAGMLFRSVLDGMTKPQKGIEIGDEDHYAMMPPYEVFLSLSAADKKSHLLKHIVVGDILVCSIISKFPWGLDLKLLCFDGKLRDLSNIPLIKIQCKRVDTIPIWRRGEWKHSYQVDDRVRVEVLNVLPHSERIVVGMKGRTLSEDMKGHVKLGVIPKEEELPLVVESIREHHGKSYETMLEQSLGFNNPSSTNHLCNIMGFMNMKHSMFTGLKNGFPREEYAAELRRAQASRWAYSSVAQGIHHFKCGQQTEAFQCLNRALSIDPDNVEGFVARGALYANSGNFEKAIIDFEDAMRRNNTHQNARKYLGETLVAYGRHLEDDNKKDEAMKMYQKCLLHIPDHKGATEAVEFLSKGTKDTPNAEPEEVIPGLSSSKTWETKKKLKHLLQEEEETKKNQKSKVQRQRQISSSSSCSDLSCSSSSTSLSSSSSEARSRSFSKSDKKTKKRSRSKSSEKKEKSFSPSSKRMTPVTQANIPRNSTVKGEHFYENKQSIEQLPQVPTTAVVPVEPSLGYYRPHQSSSVVSEPPGPVAAVTPSVLPAPGLPVTPVVAASGMPVTVMPTTSLPGSALVIRPQVETPGVNPISSYGHYSHYTGWQASAGHVLPQTQPFPHNRPVAFPYPPPRLPPYGHVYGEGYNQEQEKHQHHYQQQQHGYHSQVTQEQNVHSFLPGRPSATGTRDTNKIQSSYTEDREYEERVRKFLEETSRGMKYPKEEKKKDKGDKKKKKDKKEKTKEREKREKEKREREKVKVKKDAEKEKEKRMQKEKKEKQIEKEKKGKNLEKQKKENQEQKVKKDETRQKETVKEKSHLYLETKKKLRIEAEEEFLYGDLSTADSRTEKEDRMIGLEDLPDLDDLEAKLNAYYEEVEKNTSERETKNEEGERSSSKDRKGIKKDLRRHADSEGSGSNKSKIEMNPMAGRRKYVDTRDSHSPSSSRYKQEDERNRQQRYLEDRYDSQKYEEEEKKFTSRQLGLDREQSRPEGKRRFTEKLEGDASEKYQDGKRHFVEEPLEKKGRSFRSSSSVEEGEVERYSASQTVKPKEPAKVLFTFNKYPKAETCFKRGEDVEKIFGMFATEESDEVAPEGCNLWRPDRDAEASKSKWKPVGKVRNQRYGRRGQYGMSREEKSGRLTVTHAARAKRETRETEDDSIIKMKEILKQCQGGYRIGAKFQKVGQLTLPIRNVNVDTGSFKNKAAIGRMKREQRKERSDAGNTSSKEKSKTEIPGGLPYGQMLRNNSKSQTSHADRTRSKSRRQVPHDQMLKSGPQAQAMYDELPRFGIKAKAPERCHKSRSRSPHSHQKSRSISEEATNSNWGSRSGPRGTVCEQRSDSKSRRSYKHSSPGKPRDGAHEHKPWTYSRGRSPSPINDAGARSREKSPHFEEARSPSPYRSKNKSSWAQFTSTSRSPERNPCPFIPDDTHHTPPLHLSSRNIFEGSTGNNASGKSSFARVKGNFDGGRATGDPVDNRGDIEQKERDYLYVNREEEEKDRDSDCDEDGGLMGTVKYIKEMREEAERKMNEVNKIKQKIDQQLARSKTKYAGRISLTEQQQALMQSIFNTVPEYIDRKVFEGKWAEDEQENFLAAALKQEIGEKRQELVTQAGHAPESNVEEAEQYLGILKAEKKEEMKERNKMLFKPDI